MRGPEQQITAHNNPYIKSFTSVLGDSLHSDRLMGQALILHGSLLGPYSHQVQHSSRKNNIRRQEQQTCLMATRVATRRVAVPGQQNMYLGG
eukprot:1160449-Pelagomonas_calceolata.AAC.13